MIEGQAREIAPHSIVMPSGSSAVDNPEDYDAVLVTCLFADGSACGDPEWARMLVLRRQYELQTLGHMLADLKAGLGLPEAQLADSLEASRAKQTAEAQENAEDKVKEFSSLPGPPALVPFEEPNPARKAASIRSMAAQQYQRLIDRCYKFATGALSRANATSVRLSPNGQAVRPAEVLIARYSSEQEMLLESKPALLR
jgi:hypothetical protein